MKKRLITAAILACSANSLFASPVPLWAPWKNGESWEVTSGSKYHVNRELHALDFNRRTENCSEWANDDGAEVLSAHDGTVVFSGWQDHGFGWTVEIAYDDFPEYRTKYSHLKYQPNVRKGDFVNHGTVIGYVGHTGGTSTSDHLHFVLLDNNGYSVEITRLSGQSIAGGCITSDNVRDSSLISHVSSTDICNESPCTVSTWQFSTGELFGWYPTGDCLAAQKWFRLNRTEDDTLVPVSFTEDYYPCQCR